MSVTIAINDAGQAVIEIPDPEGELHAYRWRIIDADFDLWALLLTRTDTDLTYRVAEQAPGRWTCSCKAEKFRKRGAEHCKHIGSARSLRAFLNTLRTEDEEHDYRNRTAV